MLCYGPSKNAENIGTDRLAAWRNTLTRGIDYLWQCEQAHRATNPTALEVLSSVAAPPVASTSR